MPFPVPSAPPPPLSASASHRSDSLRLCLFHRIALRESAASHALCHIALLKASLTAAQPRARVTDPFCRARACAGPPPYRHDRLYPFHHIPAAPLSQSAHGVLSLRLRRVGRWQQPTPSARVRSVRPHFRALHGTRPLTAVIAPHRMASPAVAVWRRPTVGSLLSSAQRSAQRACAALVPSASSLVRGSAGAGAVSCAEIERVWRFHCLVFP